MCSKVHAALQSITIPDNVTEIGTAVFKGCTKLEFIISNITINDNLFEDCTSLSNVFIQDGVTTIGNYVFKNCNNLKYIIIPDTITTIGDDAYSDSSIIIIHVRSNIILTQTVDNTRLVYSDGTVKEIVPVHTHLTQNMIREQGNNNYQDITSVVLSNRILSIENNTFLECSNLESVQANNLRFIEESAFKSCTKLDTIDLSKIIYIGNNAFEGCNLVFSTINLNNVEYIGSNVFLNTTINNTIYLNERTRNLLNVTFGYNRNFYGKSGITILQANTGFDDRTTIITFNDDERIEFNSTASHIDRSFFTNFFGGTIDINTIKSIRLGSNFKTIESYTFGSPNTYLDYQIKIGYKMNNTGTGWNEQNLNNNSFFLTKGTSSSVGYYKMYVKQNGIKQYIKNNARFMYDSILYPFHSLHT